MNKFKWNTAIMGESYNVDLKLPDSKEYDSIFRKYTKGKINLGGRRVTLGGEQRLEQAWESLLGSYFLIFWLYTDNLWKVSRFYF